TVPRAATHHAAIVPLQAGLNEVEAAPDGERRAQAPLGRRERGDLDEHQSHSPGWGARALMIARLPRRGCPSPGRGRRGGLQDASVVGRELERLGQLLDGVAVRLRFTSFQVLDAAYAQAGLLCQRRLRPAQCESVIA